MHASASEYDGPASHSAPSSAPSMSPSMRTWAMIASRTNVTPNKDDTRDYRSYYSPALRELVAEWYAPEITLLGYGY